MAPPCRYSSVRPVKASGGSGPEGLEAVRCPAPWAVLHGAEIRSSLLNAVSCLWGSGIQQPRGEALDY